MALATMHDLLIAELRDIYSAETQLVRALPHMATGAATRSLRTALEDHLEQTLGHVVRLKRIFVLLDERARGTTCTGMVALPEDCDEMLDEAGDIPCATRASLRPHNAWNTTGSRVTAARWPLAH